MPSVWAGIRLRSVRALAVIRLSLGLSLAPWPAGVFAAPVITGFTPPEGPPGTLVKIVGRGLDALEAVRFNGVEADYRVVSETHIKAVVPAAATSGPLVVAAAGMVRWNRRKP